MALEPQRRVSLEDYLEIEASSQEKHELHHGQVYAMGGASARHNLIVANLVAELRARLREGPCLVFPSDLRVEVEAGAHYVYPDATVVCDDPRFSEAARGPRQDILTNPTLIVEVLSDSTEAYDRGAKFAAYRSIPSLREVLLVAQDRVAVEHHARQPDGQWLTVYVDDLEDVVPLPAVGCEVAVEEVYWKVGFGR